MKSRAALLHSQPGKWQIADVEVADPEASEVLIRMAASGLCHSDDHVASGDSLEVPLPYCGGHEGAGVVEAVGRDVTGVAVGDHIVTSFLPVCGSCVPCGRGQEYLCDGSGFTTATRRTRMWLDGQPVEQCAQVGSFSEFATLPEWACIKIDPEIPLTSAALVGCGVPTGWGSATNAANVRAGDVVLVMGVGGVGINAVQGARFRGAEAVLAVDPAAKKLEIAQTLGATHVASSMSEAADVLDGLTGGGGADAVIITTGVATGSHIAEAFGMLRRGGTVVLTAIANAAEQGIPVNLRDMAMGSKTITGALYGQMNPSRDVTHLLDLYMKGELKLDELVSKRYSLDAINEGYADLHAGEIVRGVLAFE